MRNKKGQFIKGFKPWNRGLIGKIKFPNRKKSGRQSEEHRRKISEANKGKQFSEEARRKIGDAHRGEKCTFWKGGITPINKHVKSLVEYKMWRMNIFVRDNFTCQMCNKRGGWNKETKERIILNAHHIKSFSSIMGDNDIKTYQEAINCAELWNLDNGQTLCRDCHKKTESFGVNFNQ